MTARLIESRPTLRPAEVLEFVPGVIVTQHSGDGKANQYYLRGFNLDHGTDFATWVDGMPVNMPTHAHGQGYTDLNWLIPELVDRIRYRKGPYDAEEGDFASAGSARIGLFDALPRGIAEAHARRASLCARPARQLACARRRPAALRARGRRTTTARGTTPRSSIASTASCATASATRRAARRSPRWATRPNWNATDQIPQRAVDAGLIGRFGAIDPSDGGRTARYSLSYDTERRFADGVLEARRLRDPLAARPLFRLHLLPRAPDRPRAGRNRRRPVPAVRAADGLRAGDEPRLEHEARRPRLDHDGRPAAAPRPARSRSASTARSGAGTRRRRRKAVCARPASASTPRTSSSGRRGCAASPACAPTASSSTYTSSIAGNSGSKSAGLVSPKLSLVLGPWAKTEYFVNYGYGFHSNDARGATARVKPKEFIADPNDPNAVAAPSPLLVRSKGGELGLRTEIVPGLQTSLALWQLKLGSELVFVGRRRRHRGEPAEPAARRRAQQPLHRRALAAVRRRHRRLARPLHDRRSDDAREPHPRLGQHGRLAGRDRARSRAVVRPLPAALLRAAAADRGQLAALEVDDAGLPSRRLPDHAAT